MFSGRLPNENPGRAWLADSVVEPANEKLDWEESAASASPPPPNENENVPVLSGVELVAGSVLPPNEKEKPESVEHSLETPLVDVPNMENGVSTLRLP